MQPKTNPKSREFFMQYSRDPEQIGLKQLERNYFEVKRPTGESFAIKSMLSAHEICLCYALARFRWRGGSIVDLGPLMGASSWAFARGLTDRDDTPAQPRIHTFDLWHSHAKYVDYLDGFSVGGSGSILGQWTRTLEGYHHLIEPCQGDFLATQWRGEPIDVLFIDLAKSIPLNDHVIATMFPSLQVGSIVVQQDYVHFNEYWVHMEMARLRDYFEPCYTLRGATRFYECTREIPADVCAASSSQLPYKDQIKLLDDEIEHTIPSAAEVLKSAAAKHAIENGDHDRARKLLDSVTFEAVTDNGVQEFSGIARSNHEAVTRLLESSTSSARQS